MSLDRIYTIIPSDVEPTNPFTGLKSLTQQLTESFTKNNAFNATCVSVLLGMEEGTEGLVVSATFLVPVTDDTDLEESYMVIDVYTKVPVEMLTQFSKQMLTKKITHNIIHELEVKQLELAPQIK